jgi:hypothetical protein
VRRSNIDAWAGAIEEIARIVAHIRENTERKAAKQAPRNRRPAAGREADTIPRSCRDRA